MYAVDERDKVVERLDIPSPNAGAPLPMVIANEYRCVLAYEVSYDETRYAIIVFAGNFYFGGPNDEALRGHPLASRGLRSYAAFEVENSSWIRLVEVRNRIHPHHNPERFSKLKHIIITFHDSMLEFVTAGFTVELWNKAGETVLSAMLARFQPSP
jgi:hypothetical protein